MGNKAKSLILLLRDEINGGSSSHLRDLDNLENKIDNKLDDRLTVDIMIDHMLKRQAREHLEIVRLFRELKAFYSHKILEVKKNGY